MIAQKCISCAVAYIHYGARNTLSLQPYSIIGFLAVWESTQGWIQYSDLGPGRVGTPKAQEQKQIPCSLNIFLHNIMNNDVGL